MISRARLPLLLSMLLTAAAVVEAAPVQAQTQTPAGAAAGGALEAAAPASAEPAAAASAIESAQEFPVAARDLARGEVLALADLSWVPRAAAEDAASRSLGDDADMPDSLVGWTTRRVISAGEPLLPPAVSPPDLVKAGDEVQAIWRGTSIELKISGTAAGSAALGEWVLVRIDARRRLEGVVIGPALVELQSNDRGR